MLYTHAIVSNVSDFINYDKYIYRNANLRKDSFVFKAVKNKDGLNSTPEAYNQFLSQCPASVNGWIIFCHEYFEFLDNPLTFLEHIDKNAVYGVLGVRRLVNLRGDNVNECVGKLRCVDAASNASQILGLGLPDDARQNASRGAAVDWLACQCIIIHSGSASQHNLRFAGQLQPQLPIESYPLQGTRQVPLRVIDIPCILHNHAPLNTSAQKEQASAGSSRPRQTAAAPVNPALSGVQTTEEEPVSINILYTETQPHDGFDIYHRPVNPADQNLPVVLAAKMMRAASRVLDVGCAAGDTGVFLRAALSAELWGMEHNERSVAHARQSGAYRDVHCVDLNRFSLSDYGRYYGFFDHILLADVLEHITDPLSVLKKMRQLLHRDGSMLISLPNVAHAYLIGQLMRNDFRYHDWGILDKTHLKFFTWKSMAALFAQAGLAVEQSSATFFVPGEHRDLQIPNDLPQAVYKHLLWHEHFLVCQYVSKLTGSSLPERKLLERNMKLLEAAPENNPDGMALKNEALLTLRGAVRNPGSIQALSGGELRRLDALIEGKKYIEALMAAGLFDDQWYREHNSDVDFTSTLPLAHYLTTGWREGRNPSAHFDTQWYLRKYREAADSDICPLLHFLLFGFKLNIPCTAEQYAPGHEEAASYAASVSSQEHAARDQAYRELTAVPYAPEKNDTRLIAFYLPQFYPFPENDRWWGKGFTEWTNAAKATPQFAGHYQPHHPVDLGFYDLRLEEVVLRQVELAKMYGIHGFCYYHYWFSGKKIMDMPMTRMLHNQEIDMPFCICWANEPWSARWDGSDNELLIGQSKTIDFERYIDDMLPFFLDRRYIKVAGKPLYIVHRPTFFARGHFCEFVERLRDAAQKNGLSGMHVAVALSDMNAESFVPRDFNADAFVEFPPSKSPKVPLYDIRICNPKFKGYIFDMRQLVSLYKQKPLPQELTYRTVFPMWDNTARRAELHAWVFARSSPALYRDWLSYCIEMTRQHNPSESNIVFINAWNEWGEGAHLEPDRKYGYAYLEATKNALLQTRQGLFPTE